MCVCVCIVLCVCMCVCTHISVIMEVIIRPTQLPRASKITNLRGEPTTTIY